MAVIYTHHTDYHGEWPWVSFSPKEVSCKHCGELCLDPASMDALQDLRDMWESPIHLNSGHRCFFHNHMVGGTADSQHLKLAFDCRCVRSEQDNFVAMAKAAGFRGIGRYSGFVHLDLGPRREWRG